MPRSMPARSAVLIAVPLLFALGACGKKSGPPAFPTPEVGFVTLSTGSVTLSTELPGRTSAFMSSEVRPQISGLIKARLFTEGSLVKAGQPLYQIDPSLYSATVQQATASLASAQANAVTATAKAARYGRLTDIEAVSQQDKDDVIAAAGQARASVAQAQATLRTARINLAFTRITAPITGRIGRSAYTQGALVTASQTDALATIQRLDPIFVDITQSSAKIIALRQALASGGALPASATIRLKLENGTDYPQVGRIEFAEATVDQNTGSVTIRARFPNPNNLLLPGMFVRIVSPEAIVPNAILAPQDGISRDPTGAATALVVGADNKVVQKTVTADRAIGNKWLITAGLKAGDKLIVEGVDKAKPGALVKPVAVKAN
ncbi:efflux RND transporter periplasmic adaptor subunit [Sphingomonas glacialis]|uniref:Efflux RND transporter periplasmic adaptor subunit n=1 Tax=Sphingomonas glacialis TaxID=658225 RepID=A0A502FXX1_9SPHN|nr:efflux RND transporter periplasmic adaptor subunit [Sphingomonas glacialis]TPG54309.1 efflux RND transporter periplasmic adaptor subunit [Sphingomonas glacialis]